MKILLFYLFFFWSFPGFSQYQILNNSLTDPSIPILYVGIDNIIEVKGIDDFLDYQLNDSFKKISKENNKKSIFRIYINTSTANYDTVNLILNNQIIFTKIYKKEIIQDPIAMVGNITDSVASTQEIVSNTLLSVYIPECYYKFNYWILSYSVYFIIDGDSVPFTQLYPKGSIDSIDVFTAETYKDSLILFTRTEDYYEDKIAGNHLPTALINRISKLKDGDRLVFHRIKAGCPGCTALSLDDIMIGIKN